MQGFSRSSLRTILFEGATRLSLDVLRRVAFGVTLLILPGVIVTTVITGAVASLAFNLPLDNGLLPSHSSQST